MNKKTFQAQFLRPTPIIGEPDYPLSQPGKPAAVLIPMICHDDGLSVLLTTRASHLKHHGGQVSFPGGKKEQSDADLATTALRETHEEIGLQVERNSILGSLPRYRTISRYEVVPYVALVEPNYTVAIDDNEVSEVFEVPLQHILNPHNQLTHQVQRANKTHPVYFIPWQQHMIWGATASILVTLAKHVSHSVNFPINPV